MAVRPDIRLENGGMEPVRCGTCSAQVLARKSSWDQTSIQWNDDAAAACLERRAASPKPGPNGNFFEGCVALRAAIREAAVRGDLHVQDADIDAGDDADADDPATRAVSA